MKHCRRHEIVALTVVIGLESTGDPAQTSELDHHPAMHLNTSLLGLQAL